MFKTRFQILAVMIIALSAASTTLATAPVSIAVKALSQKLKSDLAVSSVKLKLDKVETRSISQTELSIKGTGAANDLPINFDVKVNKVKYIPTEVAYIFVDAPAAPTAAADTENLLTRDLLAKLNQDYKTQNVVVSLDGFDQAQTGETKVYKGTGDVRVGFEWSKIDFDVTVDAKTNKPTVIKYRMKN